MPNEFIAAIDRTIRWLEAGTPADPMQCELCEKITDLLEAKTRWATRTSEFGNNLKTDKPEWQCKHCLAWNEP